MTRAFNFLLCVAILVGLVLFFNAQSRFNSVQSDYDRLTARYGVLDIKDSSKFYVKRIEAQNEMEFQWRVYRPDGISFGYRVDWGYSSSGISMPAKSFTLRQRESVHICKIVATESGLHALHTTLDLAGSRGHNKAVADFVKEHWLELDIETIADGEHDADELLRFLRIWIPPPLVEQLINQTGRSQYKRLLNEPVLEYSCGSREALRKTLHAKPKKRKRGSIEFSPTIK